MNWVGSGGDGLVWLSWVGIGLVGLGVVHFAVKTCVWFFSCTPEIRPAVVPRNVSPASGRVWVSAMMRVYVRAWVWVWARVSVREREKVSLRVLVRVWVYDSGYGYEKE